MALGKQHGLFEFEGIEPPKTKRAAKPQKSGNIESLAARRKAKMTQAIEVLRREALGLGLPKEQADQLAHQLRQQQAVTSDWTFVMISPAQNAAVVAWISKNSKRPQQAMVLWAQLFNHLRMDTGEIMLARQELADRLGIEPKNLSTIMTELASINAVRREKTGRAVRYFMNSNIATHLPSAKAREAARTEDGPLLKLMQGGAV